MKFKHRDIEITVGDANGKFYASVLGGPIEANSLDGMKKMIDKKLCSGFEPFDALVQYSWHTALEVRIVGIRYPRANERFGKPVWVASNGNHYHAVVRADSPHAEGLRNLCDLYSRHNAERQVFENRLRAETEAAAKLVVFEAPPAKETA
jgi:hypothetical protein